MAAKRTTHPSKKTTPEAASPVHRLDALLHTIRCIAQHEDELCTLLHDARKNGRVSKRLRADLQAVLSELPAEDYLFDLHALENELGALEAELSTAA